MGRESEGMWALTRVVRIGDESKVCLVSEGTVRDSGNAVVLGILGDGLSVSHTIGHCQILVLEHVERDLDHTKVMVSCAIRTLSSFNNLLQTEKGGMSW